MRSYTQLTREQRYQIYSLRKNGFLLREIGEQLGIHKSTVSRELKRNALLSGQYLPDYAHKRSQERQKRRDRRTIPWAVWRTVRNLLKLDWSPEQISLWLKEHSTRSVSHEWIYQHVYRNKRNGGDLHQRLRCQRKHRNRYGSYSKRGRLPNIVSIDERPTVVDERRRFGDWEVDLVEGSRSTKHALLTMTERLGRYTLMTLVPSKHASEITKAMIHMFTHCGLPVETITSDNGREFAGHEEVADTLGVDFYFAHPYSPWERGGNENTNGLIRQYAPKKSDFSKLTAEDVQLSMDRLNNRPRKCLGMKTPNQVMFGIDPTVALVS